MLSQDDRGAIQDVIFRYAHCVDDGDVAGVVDCFSDEADAGFEGGAVQVRGRSQLTDFYRRALLDPQHGASDASTHLMSDVLFEPHPDGAGVETQAVVFRVYLARNTTVLRGLRYSDVLVKKSGSWRIRDRRHQLIWQSEVPGTAQAFKTPQSD